MTRKLSLTTAALATLLVFAVAADTLLAQQSRGPWWADGRGGGHGRGWQGGRGSGGGPGPGRGPRYRGGRQDEKFVVDRDTFHYLLANHDKIRRKVKLRQDGVVTVTESDDPELASKIQEHVEAMHKRIKDNNPIRRRDPFFDALFGHTDRIEMKLKKTDNGIRVIETSDDPYVVKLIQAHAKTVSLFAENGFDEAHRNHEVPDRP